MSESLPIIICQKCGIKDHGLGDEGYAYCVNCIVKRNEFRNNILIKSPYPKFIGEMHDSFSDKTLHITYQMDESELKQIFDTFIEQPEFDEIVIRKNTAIVKNNGT
jgi:hypothetical protein